MNTAHHQGDETPPAFWRSKHAIGLLVIGAVAAYYLLTGHLAHVMGALPYLLLLACPVMHLFMHRGHGHHHGAAHDGSDGSERPGGKQ